MMKLLALDTTTDACSVALYHDGVTRVRYELERRRHTELILPMVDQLLTEANLSLNQLDAIAFCNGPGSFTGIRVVMGVVQGLAFALDLPVIPLSTLAVIAQGAYRHAKAQRVQVMVDARMGEVYFGAYELSAQHLMVPVMADCLCKQGSQPDLPGDWLRVGSGWADETADTFPHWLPNAQDLLTLALAQWVPGGGQKVNEVEPVYLRNEVAWAKIVEL